MPVPPKAATRILSGAPDQATLMFFGTVRCFAGARSSLTQPVRITLPDGAVLLPLFLSHDSPSDARTVYALYTDDVTVRPNLVADLRNAAQQS